MKTINLLLIVSTAFFIGLQSCGKDPKQIKVKTETIAEIHKIDTTMDIKPSKYGITELNQYITRHNEETNQDHQLLQMEYTLSFMTDVVKKISVNAEMGRFDRFLFNEEFDIVEPRKVIRFNRERFKEKYSRLKTATKDDFVLTIHRVGTNTSFKDELKKVTLEEQYLGDKIINPSVVIWENGFIITDEQDN